MSRLEEVKQFPESYSLSKRFGSRVFLSFMGLKVFKRNNLLSEEDIVRARIILQRGDVVLVGNLTTLFSSFLGDAITHAALAINKNKVIHSVTSGVEVKSMNEIYKEYDTMIILRVKASEKERKKITKSATNYAKKFLGKPYNFFFEDIQDSYFCSALVNDSFIKTGFDTGLKNYKGKIPILREFHIPEEHLINAIRPCQLAFGNFDIFFISHNLKIVNDHIQFLEKDENIKALLPRTTKRRDQLKRYLSKWYDENK